MPFLVPSALERRKMMGPMFEGKTIEWWEQLEEKTKGYGLFMLTEIYYMNKARREGWIPFNKTIRVTVDS